MLPGRPLAARSVRRNETEIVRENERLERPAGLLSRSIRRSPSTKRKIFRARWREHLEREHPKLVISNMAKALRKGKIFVDWSQNDEHKTTIYVYSLRAKEQPTVSTPVTWEEVENALKKKNAKLLTFHLRSSLEAGGKDRRPV